MLMGRAILSIVALLYSVYNGYLILSFHIPEYDELKTFTNVKASPAWENESSEDSQYFQAYIKGQGVSGNYYYLTDDSNADRLFSVLKNDDFFDVTVDKNKFIWEVSSNDSHIVSYQEVVETSNLNRLENIVKLIVSMLVSIYILKTVINREVSQRPDSSKNI